MLNANLVTPLVSREWQSHNESYWVNHINELLLNNFSEFSEKLKVVGAKKNGEVIIRFCREIGPANRGTLLLDLEEELKKIDSGLTVWVEPLGDKNSLRKLRGIEIKNE